jgi:hypothetical protein
MKRHRYKKKSFNGGTVRKKEAWRNDKYQKELGAWIIKSFKDLRAEQP